MKICRRRDFNTASHQESPTLESPINRNIGYADLSVEVTTERRSPDLIVPDWHTSSHASPLGHHHEMGRRRALGARTQLEQLKPA
jgi:hypothetical protein